MCILQTIIPSFSAVASTVMSYLNDNINSCFLTKAEPFRQQNKTRY